MKKLPLIIVVDDNQDNLSILVDVLSGKYNIKIANNGSRALQLARDFPPDLILLDIMMPGMNGYDVCAELKRDDLLASVPVIFISAMGEMEDKLEAFELGGVDYINKPFQIAELEARVHTHISLYRLQQELARRNKSLDEEVQAKTHELSMAHERLLLLDKSKSEFLELIAHELRTPANGIIGLSELLFTISPQTAELVEMRGYFDRARKRMVDTLDNGLLLAQIDVTGDQFSLEDVDLKDVLEHVCAEISEGLAEKTIELVYSDGIDALPVQGDRVLFTKALGALVRTSLAFTTKGESARIDVSTCNGRIAIDFIGAGASIDPAYISSFFDVFSSVRSQTYAEELGLAPALAHKICALFGGELSLSDLSSKIRGKAGIFMSLSFPQ